MKLPGKGNQPVRIVPVSERSGDDPIRNGSPASRRNTLLLNNRRSSLQGIDEALDRIVAAIARRNPRLEARRAAGGGNADTRIMVNDGQSQIKIETSSVSRGTVYPTRTMIASEAVTEHFGFVETTALAFEDVYGGKLVAALDRQHPRDLYDVKLLFENEGLTADLFRTFMV